MRNSLAMHEYCEPIADWASLAAVVVCAVLGLATRWLWKPSPIAELSQSDDVWKRILNNVIAGTALAISAVSMLYGGCGWFGRTCWTGGFCEAAWKGPPWILVSGIAAAPAAVLVWHWRTVQRAKDQEQKERELAASKLVESTRLLAEDCLSNEIAGVFELGELGLNSTEYRRLAIETLCAFIQQRSQISPKAPPTEVEFVRPSILVAIRAASSLANGDCPSVHLTLTNLNFARMNDINLSGWILAGSHMKFILADGANFSRAQLDRCELLRAQLNSADLRGARLIRAKLNKASMVGSDLTAANLRGADLCGADLRRAKLDGADLRGAVYSPSTEFPETFDARLRGLELVPGDD